MEVSVTPSDYIRCAACRKVVLRSEAVPIDGALYGRSCARKIIATYRTTHRPT